MRMIYGDVARHSPHKPRLRKSAIISAKFLSDCSKPCEDAGGYWISQRMRSGLCTTNFHGECLWAVDKNINYALTHNTVRGESQPQQQPAALPVKVKSFVSFKRGCDRQSTVNRVLEKEPSSRRSLGSPCSNMTTKASKTKAGE